MWICIKLKQIQLITIKNTPSWLSRDFSLLLATNWLHLPFGYHSELSFRLSHFQVGQLLLPAYSDTDDCKYLRSSVFFHVRAGLQSGEAGIPFRSEDLWCGIKKVDSLFSRIS